MVVLSIWNPKTNNYSLLYDVRARSQNWESNSRIFLALSVLIYSEHQSMKIINPKLTVIALPLLSALISSCGSDEEGAINNTNNEILVADKMTLAPVPDFITVSDITNLDLNKDGYQDLLLFRSNIYNGVYIQVLINQGDRSFVDESSTRIIGLDSSLRWIEKAYLADLNGDSLLDIVPHTDLNNNARSVYPLIQTSTGEFEVTTNQQLLDGLYNGQYFNDPADDGYLGAPIPIDADADGDTDLMVRFMENFGHETDQIHNWVLLENTTTAPDSMTFVNHGVVSSNARKGWDHTAFIYSPVITDVNGDGYDDFIYGGPKWKNNDFIDEAAPLHVYINSTNNQFVESSDEIFGGASPQYTHTRELAIADLNGDSVNDLVIANHGYDGGTYTGEHNSVLLNSVGSLVESINDSNSHDYLGFTHSLDVGDIDNDGDIDIVYVDITGQDVPYKQEIRILINDGTGGFSSSSSSDIGTPGWVSVKLIDLDNDNNLDMVLGAMYESGTTGSIIVWGDGTGAF